LPMKSSLAWVGALAASLAVSAVCAADELHWYRCNTHTHTSAPPGSDANETPERVVDWYRSHGYQCIVITDHEFHTDVEALNRKYPGEFLVIRGQEITQIVADAAHIQGVRHAHVNGINTNRLIMPLRPAEASSQQGLQKLAATGVSVTQTFERNLSEIERASGLPQINHPNLTWSVRLEDLLPLTKPYLLEIWNAFPTSNNGGGVDASGARFLSTEELWDALLSRGKRVWGVASDDTHEYHRPDDRESPTPGKGWIVLQAASLTEPAVMQALRDGRFYASTGIALESYSGDCTSIAMKLALPHEWSPAVQASALHTTRFIGKKGQVLAEVAGRSPSYRLRGDEKYVRASIVDSDGRRGWTQPVFCAK
jgi:hypothetical protein